MLIEKAGRKLVIRYFSWSGRIFIPFKIGIGRKVRMVANGICCRIFEKCRYADVFD